MESNVDEKVAILDAGSQYGKVIDRRVRELHVVSDLLPLETKASYLTSNNYTAIIISGGPSSFGDPNAPKCDPEILKLNIPILGICYGMQWLNVVYGGHVEKGEVREDGQLEIQIDNKELIFEGLEETQKVLLTHGDSVINLAEGLVEIGKSQNFTTALKDKSKHIYGVQFHPEVDLTVNGKEILKNFLFKICNFKGNFVMENRIEKAIQQIREVVGDKEVVVLVSGGVDSTVCCALLYKALGTEKVHGIHINTGFMREKEDLLVSEALKSAGFKLEVVDASQEFYNGVTEINGQQSEALCNVISPETKRKIIGDTFMRVIFKEIEKRGLVNYYLAQGTLRPDLIESASSIVSSKADVIKTHHNDTALVREKRKEGLIIEPLKDYHKDEVRLLGKMLGLPDYLTQRQPFPGPGLAIRILCQDESVIKENNDFYTLEKSLQEKFNDEENSLSLLPIKSVGVQGDGRTYSYVAAITGKQNWTKFVNMTKEITKIFNKINRVVYLFGDIQQISTTKTYLNETVIGQLRKADFIANEIFSTYNYGELLTKISQMPIILAPISFSGLGHRSIILRPFITNDFMTGVAAVPDYDIPFTLLDQINNSILNEVEGISRVLYDLTSKPPGTTEWE